MAITLGQVIQSIRLSHPAFGEATVTNRVLADALGRLQRSLTHQATQKLRTFLSQSFSIGFDLVSRNLPGTVGVGTTGGLPVDVSAAGVVSAEEATVGQALTFDLENAVVLFAETPVSSATATTLTRTSANFPVYSPTTDVVRIAHGPGAGSVRGIAGNSSDTLALTGTWETVPTDDSTFEIIQLPSEGDDTMGAVTALPGLRSRTGYLVRLDASGIPYVDFTQPIVTRVSDGITLPPHSQILGGTVFTSNTTVAVDEDATDLAQSPILYPFTLVGYAQRTTARGYCGYLLNQELFLLSDTAHWAGVQGVEVNYVPIPSLFGTGATAMEEYFLLPDTAYEPLVAGGQAAAAMHAKTKGVDIDLSLYRADAKEAEATWLMGVRNQQNAVHRRIPRAR